MMRRPTRFARPITRYILPRMSETTAPARTIRPRMAGSVLVLAALLAVIAGVGVAIASIVRKPDLEGILGGVFGGLLLALVIMGVGAWIGLSVAAGPKVVDTEGGDEIAASLKDVLDELEAARQQTVEDVNHRALLRVPLCAIGGVVFAIAGQFSDDPPDLMDMTMMIIAAAIGGYLWASLPLSSKYHRLYKDKVLPRLAATFGSLSYRQAITPALNELKTEGIFREFDDADSDDEIHGTHRNLPINIVELKLTAGSGKNRRTTFDGMLVTLDLPRDTGAVTAVISDAGAFGNFMDRQRNRKRERVALEDPVFEKVYEIYGTDQIAARALLHPAFMEKLLALGELQHFERPTVLCSGRLLQIALPKRAGQNLFEPPSFRKPAASRETLVQLRKDIAGVLAAADAVIDLDHRFEIQARR
jgi:hypothetical protein